LKRYRSFCFTCVFLIGCALTIPGAIAQTSVWPDPNQNANLVPQGYYNDAIAKANAERAEKAFNDGDFVLALSLYRSLADGGNKIAEYDVGLIYEQGGGGVKQNYALALDWYRRSADHGYADAQARLGSMYLSGDGVAQNIPEGLSLTKKAAEQGLPRAERGLGRIYETGVFGVSKDLGKATNWYRKASDGGDTGAQDDLRRLGASLSNRPTRATALDIKGIALDVDANSVPDLFCEQRMVDHIMQNFCGSRRFDNDNERVRLFIARHFANKIYRVELFFKPSEKLDPNTRLGSALIEKYGRDVKMLDMGILKTVWEWNNTPADTTLVAQCGAQEGVSGIGICSLRLIDEALQQQEADAQEQANSRAAPPPPKF
jgi:hypothetical protein